MIRLLALVIVCGVMFSLVVLADEPPKAKTTVKIVPKWKVGDVHRYTLTTSRKRSEGGKVTVSEKARTPAEVRVTEVTDDGGAVIVWTRGTSRLVDDKTDEDPQVRSRIDRNKAYEVELAMVESGSVQSVRNWREIQKRLRTWSDAVTNSDMIPRREVAKVRSDMEAMIDSEENVSFMSTRQPRLLFIPVGLSFEGKAPLTYEGKMVNPSGGPSYPCHGTLRLKPNDDKTTQITIDWEASVKPADAEHVRNKTLAVVSKQLGRVTSGTDDKTSPVMALAESGTFRLDPKTGWVDSLTYTYSVRQGDSTQDTVTIFESVHASNGKPTPTAR